MAGMGPSMTPEDSGPADHEEPKFGVDPSVERGESESGRNRFEPSPGDDSDETCNVVILDEPSDYNKDNEGPKQEDWRLRREQLCNKYREFRNKATERRQAISGSVRYLVEDEGQGDRLQESIDSLDRSVERYTRLLAMLGEIGSSADLEGFSDEGRTEGRTERRTQSPADIERIKGLWSRR
jgi:hypothetical protein